MTKYSSIRNKYQTWNQSSSTKWKRSIERWEKEVFDQIKHIVLTKNLCLGIKIISWCIFVWESPWNLISVSLPRLFGWDSHDPRAWSRFQLISYDMHKKNSSPSLNHAQSHIVLPLISTKLLGQDFWFEESRLKEYFLRYLWLLCWCSCQGGTKLRKSGLVRMHNEEWSSCGHQLSSSLCPCYWWAAEEFRVYPKVLPSFDLPYHKNSRRLETCHTCQEN